ncbi:hypothetical protein [Desulfobacter curvatus]|uniref:hypothetical protein n=1 Tax=Desulfobacter curvatus TaxID=2290 RepID=UPI0003797CBD|nr:hypothetical protein [Desulfobacter curvatus]
MFRITRIFAGEICAGENILQQGNFPIADHGSRPFDPDVSSDHGVIFAVNGTCKTTLISFLLNTFCPDQKRFVQHLQSGGDKTLSQYLVPGRPAVIFIEMAVPREENLFDDTPEERLVIGQVLYSYKEASKPLVRYYFQAQAPDFFDRMQQSWPKLLEHPKPLTAVREFLHHQDNQVVITDVQKDWGERLEKIGLDPWLVDRQIDFARSEGGIKDAFRFRSEADFLSFFLGCVTDMDFAGQLRDATLTNMEKMRTMPWKKKRLAAVLSLKTRLEDFQPIAAEYLGAKEKQKHCDGELEQAAFLVSRALPKAGAEQQQAHKRLAQAQEDESKAQTDLNGTRADLAVARGFSLDLAQKERLGHAADLNRAIKAGEALGHALDAADILARINLITGRLQDKQEALTASGSALTPLREKADQHARAFHACITQRRQQTQRQIEAAKAQAATAKEKQDACRRELKETQKEHTRLNNETNRLQARLEMALEAGNAIDPHFLEAPGDYSNRLKQDLNRTGKDLSQTREKHKVLNETLARENQNREALSIQKVRDQTAIDEALACKAQEKTWRERLISDSHIRTAAGSDNFDPTNAAHVSALSDAISRKTQDLTRMEKEERNLSNELKSLDEVRTLAVDDQTRRLIRHYRDIGISPTQIRAFPEYLASLEMEAEATAQFIHRDPARFTGIMAASSQVMEEILALEPPAWLRRPVVLSLPVTDITTIDEIAHKRILPKDPSIYTLAGTQNLKQTISEEKQEKETLIRDLLLTRNAMEKSLNDLKAFREVFPDPAAVKRLDLDLDLAKKAHEKTCREISAAQDRITDIKTRITRCDSRIEELTSDKARFGETLKHARQWLAQYGEWKSWQQQAAQNKQILKKLDLGIITLESQASALEQAAMDAGNKIPALEKDRDRLDELAGEIPLPLGAEDKNPDTQGHTLDMSPQDIKSLYFQAQANLQQRSTELGVAALEREVQDLGRDLSDLQGKLTRFESDHAFDPDQARDWAAKASMERQVKRDLLAAQAKKDSREQSRAEAQAEVLEKEAQREREALDLLEKKQIAPRLTPDKLQGFSLQNLENTVIPDLETAKQNLESRLETLTQQISRAREDMESVNTWFNTLKTLAARAGDPPETKPSDLDPNWPDLLHPQNRQAHCMEMENRVKQLQSEKKEQARKTQDLERKRDAKYRALDAHIRDSDVEGIVPALAAALKEHDADSMALSCSDLIKNCTGIAATLEGDLSRSKTLMDTHVSQLLEHAKDCHQKLTAATQVAIPEQVFIYGGKPILRAAAKLNFSRFDRAYKESLENWMEECIQKGLCPQVNPAEGNCLGADLLYRLLAVEAKKSFNIRLLKCDDTARNYEPVGKDLGSGGEALTTAVLLYALLVYMRSRRFKSGARPMPGFLILDNPLGVCNRPDFLDAQLKVAKALGVQCIYLTGINDTGSIELFAHRIVIQKAGSQLLIDGRPFEKLETIQIHVEG